MPEPHAAAEHLAVLVRYPTVAPDPGVDPDDAAREAFTGLHGSLREFYPTVFRIAHADELGHFGLLLRIPGRTPTRPVVLMAHQDVVPTQADWQRDGWSVDPFSGTVAGGKVTGRGTLDDKGALVTLLEAVESLLASGWEPNRDLYLLFGADEEKNGSDAVEATALLESRGIVPHLVLDEGGAVAAEAFPGVDEDIAVIGVCEKGLLTVRLSVTDAGGHASTPPRKSAPGVLARALVRIEDHPFPPSLHPVTAEMLQAIAPKVNQKAAAMAPALLNLSGPLARVLARLSPELAAMVRTTVAITRLEGSPGANVLATSASATLNIRIATESTVEETLAYLRKVVRDPRVSFDVETASEPSPISPRDERFTAITDAVQASYGVDSVPYIMLAGSDGRHLARIAPAVYRFSPLRMDKAQRGAIHGVEENVEIDSINTGIGFYRSLLTGPALGPVIA